MKPHLIAEFIEVDRCKVLLRNDKRFRKLHNVRRRLLGEVPISLHEADVGGRVEFLFHSEH